MAGLKRRLIDSAKMLNGMSMSHALLVAEHAKLKKDYEQLLSLVIGLAREAQDRPLIGRPLTVSRKLVEDTARDVWHLDMVVATDKIRIRAVAELGTREQEAAASTEVH